MELILRNLTIAETDLSLSDSAGTMFQSGDVYIALYRYVSFTYCCRIDQTMDDFRYSWAYYNRMRLPELRRIYDAMKQQYDPLANYDMTEHGADGRKHGTETSTTTPHGSTTETSTTTGKETTTYNRQGADSSTFQPYDQSVTESDTSKPRKVETTTTYGTGTYSDTQHTYTNDQTATVDGVTVTGNDTNEHVMTRKGNIGITSSQQLLQAEISVRQYQILADYIGTFIKEFCYLGRE